MSREAATDSPVDTAPGPGVLSTRSALFLAYAFGLATGWGEVALRGVQKLGFGTLIYQSRHIVWMAPLADVGLFLSVGLLVILVGRLFPRPVTFRWVTFVFTAMLLAAPLTSFQRIHWLAGSILSIGIAWRLAAFLDRRERVTRGAIRVVTVGLTVATVAAFAFMIRGSTVVKTATPRQDSPNVLLIVWDTVREKSVDLTGGEAETTPVLAELAESGVTFESAFATAPWTLPSHGSLFTGRFPDEFAADWEIPLDDGLPTLAERLGDLGYDTGGFAGNLMYTSWESGLDRGFDRYEDYPLSLRTVLNSGWLTRKLSDRLGALQTHAPFTLRTARQINGAFLAWLDGRSSERPYFAFLNLIDAHKPYTPPDDLYERFAPGYPRPQSNAFREWSPQEIEAERAAYRAEIALLDRELGLLLEALEAREERDNTLIIVTSDHGESFGEHGLFDHGNALYRPVLHVPLVIAGPGTTTAGLRSAEPVSIADIPATVMAVAAPGSAHPFPGESLLNSERAGRPIRASVRSHRGLHESIPLSRGDMSAVIVDDWYYILNGDGVEELYSLSGDRDESVNLASEETAVSSRLRSLLPDSLRSP